MSNRELARRTVIEVYFDGTDISESIRKYLISLSYTDNEEDEADDLQIKLEDRDGIWLEQWLSAAVQSAADGSLAEGGAGDTAQYRVTARSGLNVRSGPGTSHGRLGALTYGTVIDVISIADGWASIVYNDKEAYVYDAYIEPVEGTASAQAVLEDSRERSIKGLSVQAIILRENWNGDGMDKVLDCGEFELDSITASGPPSEVSIKCTSIPYSSRIRQSTRNRAWEGCRLSGIAQEIAERGGMSCIFESEYDPEYERLEQVNYSDISFLSILCHNAGISLKVTNNILVLFNQAVYEAKDSVMTIAKGDGQYLKYRLNSGSADTEYDSCRVSYTDPETGALITASAFVEDYKEDDEDNMQLEINTRVASVGEAQALAEKMLRLKNKYEYTASFDLPGNPELAAGVTIELVGWGPWSGKYIIKQSKHNAGSSGYITSIDLRKVLEGY